MIDILIDGYQFMPSSNPVLLILESDNANLLFYKVVIKEAKTNEIIYTANVYPKPNSKRTYFNMQNILATYVQTDISFYADFLFHKPLSTVKYKVEVTEVAIVNNVVTELTDTLNISGNRYVFDANLSTTDYVLKFNEVYIVDGYYSLRKFLTFQDKIRYVNKNSVELVSFISPYYGVQCELNVGGVTNRFELEAESEMYCLNMSPFLYLDSGEIDENVRTEYSVTLFNKNDSQISETKTYIYEPDFCKKDITNVIFSNSLGGVDSVQFTNSTNSFDVDRKSVERNNMIYDENMYSPFLTLNRINDINKVYSSTLQQTIRCYSDIVDDEDVNNYVELFKSKSIYIVDENFILYPVRIKATNFVVERTRQTRTYNQFFFEFELDKNITIDV